jgi:cathepsin L
MTLSLVLVLFGVADSTFEQWRHRHNKVYLTADEEAAARRNFAVNDALINKPNSSLPYTLGHNAYSDQDLASLASRRNGFVASAKLGGTRRHTPRSHSSLPSAVDWASAGAVSPVKDQGTCGSCWSFAATGAIEASLFVDRGVSTSLSEEQLIDCDKGAPQDGCKGGAIEEAFRWVRRRRAIRRNSAQFGAIL